MDDFTGDTSLTGLTLSAPLLVCRDELARYATIESPNGDYVRLDTNTQQYTSGPKGILCAHPKDNENEQMWLTYSNETEISKKLNSRTPVYTTSVGVGYADGARGGLLIFEDAIVEYRNNINKVSSKSVDGRTTEMAYLKTYVSVGIPIQRYSLMVENMESYGVPVTNMLTPSYVDSAGYAWIVANITKDYEPTMVIVANAGVSTIPMMQGMMKIRKNVIGYATMTCSLKRSVKANGALGYKFGFSLKSFQVKDVTTIASPPLNKVGTTTIVAPVQSSSEIMTLLSSKAAPKAPGNIAPTLPKPVEASTSSNAPPPST